MPTDATLSLLEAIFHTSNTNEGHLEQPLPLGLRLVIDSHQHDTDVHLTSLGDTLAQAHTGDDPNATLFGDGPGPDTFHLGFIGEGNESNLFATSSDDVPFNLQTGEHSSLSVFDIFNTDHA